MPNKAKQKIKAKIAPEMIAGKFPVKMEADDRALIRIDDFISDDEWTGISPKDINRQLDSINATEIDVRINSYGGSVFAGWAIYNALKNHSATINVYIEGIAASMASLIALAGDNTYIATNAFYMIHNSRMGVYGTKDDMAQAQELMEKIDTVAVGEYTRTSDLSELDVRELMDGETFMSGQEAVDFGFIQAISDPAQAATMQVTAKQIKESGLPEAMFANATIVEDTALEVTDIQELEGQLNIFTGKPEQAATNPATAETKETEVMPKETATQAADNQAAIDKARDETLAQARQNTADVYAVFEGHDQPALLKKCITDGVSAGDAAIMLTGALAQHAEPVTGGGHAIVSNNELDGIRAGFMQTMGLQARESGNKYYGLTAMEFGREWLKATNQDTHGAPMEVAARIMRPNMMHGTDDFNTLLKTATQVMITDGFEEAPSMLADLTTTRTVSDFKITEMGNLTNFSQLELVTEGGEYEKGTMGATKEPVQVLKWGIKAEFTWESLINNQLYDTLQAARLAMSNSARRKEDELVVRVFADNPKMSDGKALFHSDHGNLTTDSDLDADGVEAAISKFKSQKDKDSKQPLLQIPSYIVVNTADEFKAAKLFTETTGGGDQNVLSGRLAVLADPRLDDQNNGQWHLARSGAIAMIRLQGHETPMVFENPTAEIDGYGLKIRHVVAAKPLDYYGLQRNVKTA